MDTLLATEEEKKCFEKLINMRWKDGYRCENCGCQRYWVKTDRRIIICKNCRKEVSPLSETMFSRSHISLGQWFEIIRIFTCSPDIVVTASEIYRRVGIGSYRTAWEALCKLRYCISKNEPKPKLRGNIEFDELVINGDGSDYSKISILGALEIDGRKRLSLRMVKNPDEMNIKGYFRKLFTRNATVIIDPEKLYIRNWLKLNRIKQISAEDVSDYNLMNIHIILQDLKYGLRNGQHSVSEKYLQYNLDEYAFIFNHNDNREKAFELLLQYMVSSSIKDYRQSKKPDKSFLSIISDRKHLDARQIKNKFITGRHN